MTLVLLAGCNLKPEVVKEDKATAGSNLTDNTRLESLFCLTSWDEDLTEEKVLETFADSGLNEGVNPTLSSLFQEPKFIELKNESSPLQLCVFDNEQIGFAFYKDSSKDQKTSYSDTEELNNVIGLYTERALLITDYKYNKNSGDIGQCVIIGYLDGVLYRCGGGDGPFSFRKVYLLMRNGQSKTIQDCEFVGEYSDGEKEYKPTTSCEVDLMGTALDARGF